MNLVCHEQPLILMIITDSIVFGINRDKKALKKISVNSSFCHGVGEKAHLAVLSNFS